MEGRFEITPEIKQALINRTVKFIGNNPSASGFSADEIRRYMYQAIAGIDVDDSEINLADLINELATKVYEELDLKESVENVDAIKTALEESISKLSEDTDEKLSTKVAYDEFSGAVNILQAQHTTIQNELTKEIAKAREFAVNSIGDGTIRFFQNNEKLGEFTTNTSQTIDIRFKNIGVDLTDYYQKRETYSQPEVNNLINNIREVAEGKNNNFVTDDDMFKYYADDERYDQESQTFYIAQKTDEQTSEEWENTILFTRYADNADDVGVPVRVKDVHTGDNIFVINTQVPDWWVYKFYSDKFDTGVILGKLEIGKIDLSNFATTDYVDENGGKIDQINVNGVPQPITNKVVDLQIESGGNVDAVYLGNDLCPNVDKKVTIPAKEATTAPLIEPDEFPIVESISDQSTNNQIPTAKAVYDFAAASVGGLAEYVDSNFVKTSNLKKDIPSTRASTKISLDSSNVSKTSITGGTLGGVSFYVYSEKANGTNTILITGRFYIENYSRGGSGGTGVTITLPSDTILDNFANSETISRFMAFKTDNYKEGSAIVGVQPMYVNTIAGTKQISVMFQESFSNPTSGTYQVYMPQTIIKV